MRKLDLVLAMGLPGSGKSTKLKTLKTEYAQKKSEVKYIDWDTAKESGWNSLDSVFKATVAYGGTNLKRVTVIVDYPFTTVYHVNRFVTEIKKLYDVCSLLVVHFNLDRETCLKNDLGRRNINSQNSIKKMNYDAAITADNFNCLGIPVIISEEQVVEKQGWQKFVKENVDANTISGKYLKSQSWTTGGTTTDYDGNSHTVDGDEPLDFVELDNIIEKIRPNITFMQYKRMMRDLKEKYIVTLEDGSEGDYYGTWSTAWWECNLEKFYEYLKEHNYIENE